MDASDPVIVEVVRSAWVESIHRGRVVVVDATGALVVDRGATREPVLLRSCAKPLQVVGMLRAGWPAATDQAVALACASHDGTDAHLAVAAATLAAAGLDPSALGNTEGLALEPTAAARQLLAGGPDRIHHNCSGKHAAMLATCAARGWTLDGYLGPHHPLQEEVLAAVEDLVGERAAHLAVDGCGAPIAAVSLRGLARAFGRLATAAPGTPEHQAAAAMRAHPELVAGTARPATLLMRAIPGSIAKDGAEGVFAAALPDGRAVAVKVDDGTLRASVVAVAAALADLVIDDPAVDLDALTELALPEVEGGGRPVGEVRPVG